MEIQVEMKEITPTVEVPITLHAPAKALTAEERKAMYAELRQYHDIHLLPLPADFFDDDVESERGITQLQHDAHMVGLLDKKMITMSEDTTSRLLHLNKVGGTTISSSTARKGMKREWFPAGSSSPPGDRLQIARRTSPRRLLGTVSFTLFASCCAKFYGVQPTLRRFVAATWCAVRVLWAKIVARIFPP
jgi:hypothetical protein